MVFYARQQLQKKKKEEEEKEEEDEEEEKEEEEQVKQQQQNVKKDSQAFLRFRLARDVAVFVPGHHGGVSGGSFVNGAGVGWRRPPC